MAVLIRMINDTVGKLFCGILAGGKDGVILLRAMSLGGVFPCPFGTILFGTGRLWFSETAWLKIPPALFSN